MSSDSEENFDLSAVESEDSDDFIPEKKIVSKGKATKVPVKPKALANPKPPAKSRVKKKDSSEVLKPIDKNVSDNDMDFNINHSEDENDAGPSQVKRPPPVPRGQGKTASEMYQMLSQIEHILKRPDSYIGSIEHLKQNMWAFDSDANKMVFREIQYVPGFFKIVDEILVNAADNKINDPSMDTIKVDINVEENTISIYNNGRGIPIEIHSVQKIYIPDMIFGHLLTSSNYDDDEKKLTGGRNGYGAKLTNIYSTEFIVETADRNTEQKYKQVWNDNMSKKTPPKITKNTKKEEYTKVTFKPDLKRFGMEGIDKDVEALLKKRVYDIAGTVKDVKVFLNGERLKVKGFKQYVDMYVTAAAESQAEAAGGASVSKPQVIFEQLDRWEVAFAVSDSGTFQHVAFANSISTTKGGTHVMAIADQICKKLLATIEKKNKGAAVKPTQMRNHMWIFVNALIENPTFDSQTKEQLTLPASKFGSKPTLSDDFIKKVSKSGLIDYVLNWAKFKADQYLKKTDGTKRARLTGMAKLSDANNAGGRGAKDCTLILTEGDSAKALAEVGLGVVGRDNFGVFPLRGKLLNVRDATHDQIMKNQEIQNIKKIMGLQHAKDYKDTSSLRYGSLMIMTDQDHDGSHIKGLLINFLDHFYPSLLKIPSFLVEFVTPIVRVWKGNQKKDFFTLPEYISWMEEHNQDGKWQHKYYKGLGTSENKDGQEYFSHMEKHMIPFAAAKDEDRLLIDMAFSKKKADERKDWLRKFKPGTFIDHAMDEISYDDFINKELILFSMADNIRSIPCVVDGLKPGQRKILFGCFKRNLKAEIKVSQLAGYIAEKTEYHHGEQSLTASIVNMAQNYVGSNNLNVLQPRGQYGTRSQGGKDHASARYIYTCLEPITRMIFHPADDPLLNYLTDDGSPVEPEWYIPILPLVLVNGGEGIGTGWSTNIPPFNPVDIVANIRRLMNGEELQRMVPWFRHYIGTVEPLGADKFQVSGIAVKVEDTTIDILELPIYKWTEAYKEQLEKWVIDGAEKDKDKEKDKEKGPGKEHERFIKDYREHHTDQRIHFSITMSKAAVEKAEKEGLLSYFKLTTTISTSNMMCFDPEGRIKKYSSPEEILEEFYPLRLAFYQKRKDYLCKELETQLDRLSNQVRFIKMMIAKEMTVSNRKKADIVAELRKKQFRPFPKVSKALEAGENEAALEDEDQPAGATSDYDYLLGMPIWSLTWEKVEKLMKERESKEEELNLMLKMSSPEMWNNDLDVFLKHWEKIMEEDRSKAKGSTKARKQATLRTRKSVGKGKKKKAGSDDDSDFDLKPSKLAAKKQTTISTDAKSKPKPNRAKIIEIMEDDDSDVPMDPKKARKVADSDVEAKGKAKAATKRKSPDLDDEDGKDSDMYVKPAKKSKSSEQAPAADFFDTLPESSKLSKGKPMKVPAARKAPAPKKTTSSKKKVIESEEDDEDFNDAAMEEPSPPRPARNAPRRAARGGEKKYVDAPIIDIESDSDDDLDAYD